MRTALVVSVILILTGSAALSQGRSVEAGAARPSIGSKSMDSCRADQQKFCATAPSAVLKECLVTQWNGISSDCQDALATPVYRIGGTGRSRSD